MRVSIPHSPVSTLLVVIVASTCGCVTTATTTQRPTANKDIARRIENAFELEKQRRASMPQSGYARQNPGLDSVTGLRASLASERQRRGQLEKELADLRAQGAERGPASAELASLRAELSGERNRNRALKKELDQAQQPASDGLSQEEFAALEAQLERERQRRQILETELARLTKGNAESGESTPELAQLRQELQQERRRRLEVEEAWQRLRDETSVPALGGGAVAEAEYLAVKQELIETQRALDTARKAHQKVDDVSTVPPAAPPVATAASSPLSQENQRLRQRLTTLRRERDVLKRAIIELGTESAADPNDEIVEPEAQRVPVH